MPCVLGIHLTTAMGATVKAAVTVKLVVVRD
eukprot:CAMPEP_0119506868 /NCGR_PEP_ID=MMETSP1344-20130328/26946_1 /TAXON_ID=236787 /ORGANISM="Florenciella parvula, Strain CCMP2471" /LENGTH=30 /DNA_ID= /DNA_START= /DNA_END= /DNA_ORIENTATION=